MNDRTLDSDGMSDKQPDCSPPPLPSVHDTIPGLVGALDYRNTTVPGSTHWPQNNVGNLEQGLDPRLTMEIENSQRERPHQISRPTRPARFSLSPSVTNLDRPWSHLQTTHSPRALPFEVTQQYMGLGSFFVSPAHPTNPNLGTQSVLGPTSAPDGFFSFWAEDPALIQPLHGNLALHGSSGPLAPSVFPGAIAPDSTQSFAWPNASLSLCPVAAGSQDDVETQSLHNTAEISQNLGHSHTKSSTTRARGARSEARRGQPRPRRWTTDEEHILLRMYAERKNKDEELPAEIIRQIAQAMGKSSGAVQAKYWRLQGGDPKASKKTCHSRGGPRGGKRDKGHDDSGGSTPA